MCLPARRGSRFLSAIELSTERVETRFPKPAVARKPAFELAERLCTQRVQAFGSEWPDRYETRVLQDAKVTGHARLMDIDALDDVVYGLFAAAQHFDDAQSLRIG